jgi:hypothetical protein
VTQLSIASYSSSIKLRTIVNYVGLQLGWLACVVGAAQGYPWAGPVVVGGHLVIHFLWTQNRRQEALFVLVVAMTGIVVDSLQKTSGLLSYAGDVPVYWLAPYWIIAMWVLFATAMTTSLQRLQGKYLFAAAVGAIGGPLSYVAGEKLNGIEFNYDFWPTVIIISLIWATVMVWLSWLVKSKSSW